MKITISDYCSPTILARLNKDRSIFDEHIEDFRTQIDYVLIDTDYTGEHFTRVECDAPKKKEDFIDGILRGIAAAPGSARRCKDY